MPRQISTIVRAAARRLACTLLVLGLSACASPWTAPGEQLPSWLKARLDRSVSFPVAVWKAKYQGKTAYLLIMPCCDFQNPLHDAAGAYLCAPTGGFSGGGDRKCAPQQPGDDYHAKLIWQRGGPPK